LRGESNKTRRGFEKIFKMQGIFKHDEVQFQQGNSLFTREKLILENKKFNGVEGVTKRALVLKRFSKRKEFSKKREKITGIVARQISVTNCGSHNQILHRCRRFGRLTLIDRRFVTVDIDGQFGSTVRFHLRRITVDIDGWFDPYGRYRRLVRSKNWSISTIQVDTKINRSTVDIDRRIGHTFKKSVDIEFVYQ